MPACCILVKRIHGNVAIKESLFCTWLRQCCEAVRELWAGWGGVEEYCASWAALMKAISVLCCFILIQVHLSSLGSQDWPAKSFLGAAEEINFPLNFLCVFVGEFWFWHSGGFTQLCSGSVLGCPGGAAGLGYIHNKAGQIWKCSLHTCFWACQCRRSIFNA